MTQPMIHDALHVMLQCVGYSPTLLIFHGLQKGVQFAITSASMLSTQNLIEFGSPTVSWTTSLLAVMSPPQMCLRSWHVDWLPWQSLPICGFSIWAWWSPALLCMFRTYCCWAFPVYNAHVCVCVESSSIFRDGLNVIRRSDRFLGQFVYKPCHWTGVDAMFEGLIRGCGMSEIQRSVWLLFRPVCTEVNVALQEFTEV